MKPRTRKQLRRRKTLRYLRDTFPAATREWLENRAVHGWQFVAGKWRQLTPGIGGAGAAFIRRKLREPSFTRLLLDEDYRKEWEDENQIPLLRKTLHSDMTLREFHQKREQSIKRDEEFMKNMSRLMADSLTRVLPIPGRTECPYIPTP